LTEGARAALAGASRPGNVRELAKVLERSAILAAGAPAGETQRRLNISDFSRENVGFCWHARVHSPGSPARFLYYLSVGK
jgi:transcriptional regulator with GAF, ATPase, and Fis domain